MNKIFIEKKYENDEVCLAQPYNKINIGDEKKINKDKDLIIYDFIYDIKY